MPYNTKEKQKAYYERHAKFYNKRFISANRDMWNQYQNEYKKKKRKELGFDKYYQSAKNDPIKHIKLLDACREWAIKNKAYSANYFKNSVEVLTDEYISRLLSRTMLGIKRSEIRRHKELIDLVRNSIKLKRLIKWKKQKSKQSEI